MKPLGEYVLPLLVVGLAYMGFRKAASAQHWSLGARFLTHLVAIALFFGIIVYEYFAGRSLTDMTREAVGGAFCSVFQISQCPVVRAAAEAARRAHEEADRQAAETERLAKEERDRQTAEGTRRAKEDADRQAAEAERLATEERDRRAAAEVARHAKEEADRRRAELERRQREETSRRNDETDQIRELNRSLAALGFNLVDRSNMSGTVPRSGLAYRLTETIFECANACSRMGGCEAFSFQMGQAGSNPREHYCFFWGPPVRPTYGPDWKSGTRRPL